MSVGINANRDQSVRGSAVLLKVTVESFIFGKVEADNFTGSIFNGAMEREGFMV